MWTVIGSMIILVLACYGVYYLVQDLLRLCRAEPGPPVSMLVVIRDRAQDLEYLIRRLNDWRKRQWVELELVLVDDGSTDDTSKILRNLQNKYSYRLLSLPQGPREGKPDEALQIGLLHCHNALVWLVDMRMLPQGLLAEKVFRVFFYQDWR